MSPTSFGLLVIGLQISCLQSPCLTLDSHRCHHEDPSAPNMRDATGVFVLRLSSLLQTQQMIFVLLILFMARILMARRSFSLLPLPSRQKQPLAASKENLIFLEREEGGLH